MKIVLKLLTVVGMLFAVGASAQNFQGFKFSTVYSGGTNKVLALATNSIFRMDVPKAENLCLYVNTAHLNASGAGDVDAFTMRFWRGFEGGIRETNTWFTWVVPTGATTVNNGWITNLSVLGVPYVYARLENNSTNSHVTNVVVQYGNKN